MNPGSRTRRTLALMGGLVLLFAAAALPVVAQDTRQAAEDEFAEYRPMHRLRFPGSPYVQSAAFSRDGNTLFVHVNADAINVWELLVYYWPEILGAGTAATALVCSLILWRILRRRRFVGEPHCRRCNYCLKGLSSDRCPECGTPVERPVIGRPMWRRTLPFALPLALVLIAYGSLWALRTPRSGSASMWLHWWSYDLHDWAQQKGVSLTQWQKNVDRIIEVDVATGKTQRTLITRSNRLHTWCPLAVTPDGDGLLMTLDSSDRLALVSTRSGRVRCTLAHGDSSPTRTSRWQQIAGFDDAGRIAYVVVLDEPAKRTKLLEWDLRSGSSAVLIETDADVVASRSGRLVPWARRFYKVPGSGPPRFLEMPSSMGIGADKSPVELRVHDTGGSRHAPVEFATSLWAHSTPGFSSNGERVYVHASSSVSGLAGFDLGSGEPLAGLNAPQWHHILFESCCDQPRGRLIVAGTWHRLEMIRAGLLNAHPHVFLVCDLDARRWIGRYVQPSDGIYHTLWVSPDGRYFAAYGFLKDSKKGGRYQHDLLIYDLRSLPHDIDFASQDKALGGEE